MSYDDWLTTPPPMESAPDPPEEETDEEYVRANWDDNVAEIKTDRIIFLWGLDHSKHITPYGWSVLAEFTRDRLEQIRQLGVEIEMVKRQLAYQPNENDVLEYSARYVRLSQANVARWSRILARIESALADLKRDMK